MITLSFAPPGHHGVAAAFLQLTQRLSATFCVALVASVMFASGSVGTSGVQHGLIICSGLALTACLLSFSRSLQSGTAESQRPSSDASEPGRSTPTLAPWRPNS